jgi:hypothetical protein
MDVASSSWRRGLNEVRFVYGFTVDAKAWRVEALFVHPPDGPRP